MTPDGPAPHRWLDRSSPVAPSGSQRWGLVAVAVAIVAFVGVQQWGADLLDRGVRLALNAPPFLATWRAEWPPGMWWALAAAVVLAVVWVPLTERLPWRAVLLGSGAVALLWPVLLQASEGWDSLASILADPLAYLPTAQAIDSPAEFLRTYVDRLPDYPTHVKGHPPGATLAHWLVDTVGGGRSDVLTATFLVIAASAAPASLIALDRIAGRDAARRAAPFAGLAPAVIWIATSPDAMFMGVIAWAVALGAVAITAPPRWGLVAGFGAGLLAGVALSLSYGSMLLLGPLWALAILAGVSRRWQPLVPAAVGFAAIPLWFMAHGFDWFAGLAATNEAYQAGVAPNRPASYFLVSNLAVFAVMIGPAAVAGLARLREARVWWLVGGGVAAVVTANLSLLSKGEVERIWLPAVPFVLLAVVAVERRWERHVWLALQLAVAIALQVYVASPW